MSRTQRHSAALARFNPWEARDMASSRYSSLAQQITAKQAEIRTLESEADAARQIFRAAVAEINRRPLPPRGKITR